MRTVVLSRGAIGFLFLLLTMTWLRPVCAMEPSIEASPLDVVFDSPSQTFPQLAYAERHAFYLATAGGTIELAGEPLGQEDGVIVRRVYATEDGRTATLTIADGPEETLRIRFSVDSKGEFEKLGVRFLVTPDEGFYGLMERVVQGSQGFSWQPGMTEGLDLRGQTVDLYVLPTLSIYAPFFLSSEGYGVFVESDYPGTYRFGVTAEGASAPTEVTVEQEGPELSFLLLPGPEPIDVVKRYARLTGLPLVPPAFLLGPGRWRDVVWNLPTFHDGTHYDGPYNSMIVEDVLMMDALEIPCTWMVVDRPWATGSFGYGSMQVDEERLPDFDAMVDWLDSRGISTLLWLGPWVMDEPRAMAKANGYDVPVSLPYLPQASLIDFTSPDAVDWWSGAVSDLLETGIAGFKLDRGEEKTPDGQLFRGAYLDGTDYREGHNAYPLWFAQTVADITAASPRADDLVSFYRAGWPGMSQVVAAWGGDSDPSAWGLRSAIIGLQRAAILNTPIWGSDTGGYNTRPPREVLARWLAFSAFTPIMEVGPMANLAPWSWLPDESDEAINENGYTFATVYDDEVLAIWSMYANIHADLVRDVMALAEEAGARGTPIVRPMVLAYPDEPAYRNLWSQYLYGPDLLVRPVWEPGIEQVTVEIPEGRWIDAWTGNEVEGPSAVRVDVPLHVIPLFLRAGGSIHLGDLAARWQRANDAASRIPDLPTTLP